MRWLQNWQGIFTIDRNYLGNSIESDSRMLNREIVKHTWLHSFCVRNSFPVRLQWAYWGSMMKLFFFLVHVHRVQFAWNFIWKLGKYKEKDFSWGLVLLWEFEHGLGTIKRTQIACWFQKGDSWQSQLNLANFKFSWPLLIPSSLPLSTANLISSSKSNNQTFHSFDSFSNRIIWLPRFDGCFSSEGHKRSQKTQNIKSKQEMRMRFLVNTCDQTVVLFFCRLFFGDCLGVCMCIWSHQLTRLNMKGMYSVNGDKKEVHMCKNILVSFRIGMRLICEDFFVGIFVNAWD